MAERGYQGVFTVGGNTVGKTVDLTTTIELDEIDVTSRDSAGYDENIPGIIKITFNNTQIWIPTDAAYAAMEAAALGRSVLAAVIEDSAGYGWSGNVHIYRIERGEPLRGAMTVVLNGSMTGTIVPESPAS